MTKVNDHAAPVDPSSRPAPSTRSGPASGVARLRGPWLTAVLSVALLPGITLMFLTGLAPYAAYNPNLAPGNDTTPDKGLLGSWLPGWPADPSWLYWLNQGAHVTLGLVLIPIVLAKL
jgi:hypothetical protein